MTGYLPTLKKIFGVCAFVIIAFSIAVVVRARSFDFDADPPALAKIRDVPIELPDGSKAVLGDAIRPGIPTIINFWASWCGPCLSEAPLISDLRRKYGPDHLNLLYLNVRDTNARREDLTNYMEAFGMDGEGYLILEDRYIGILTNEDDQSVPRTLVYDDRGQPLGMITGYRPMALERIEGMISK